jgi:hypothetical protein
MAGGAMSPEEWLKQQQKVAPVPAAAASATKATLSPEEWLKQQPQAQAPVTQPSSQEEPQTSIAGVTGAVARGLAPVATGAALGAAIGAPIGGVGAIPGAAAGAAAGGLATLIGDPIVDVVNSTFGTQWTRPTDAMEDMLTRMGVPKPKTEAERIIKSTAEATGGAAGGIQAAKVIGQAARGPVTQVVAREMAAQPAAQLAGAGAAGGAAQLVQEAGGSPLAATGASLLAGMGGARMATPSVRIPPSAAGREIVQAGERFNVPVMTSDVRPPETFLGRTGQQIGERTFFGTSAQRGAQQQARIEAVGDVLSGFGVNANALKDEALQPVANAFLAKRSADLSRYSGMKKSIFEPLDTLGNVPATKTTLAIDQEISRLRSITGSQPLINKLEELKFNLQNNPNISAVEANRKVIGNWMNDADLASVKTEAEKTARTLYGPLKDDMGNFIAVNGAPRDFTKWNVANKRLAEMTGELNNSALSKALKEGDAKPETMASLLFTQSPSDLKLLYKNLPPSGRKNAQRAILWNAAEKAKFRTQEGEQFSPDLFNKYLKDNRAQLEVFFQGDAKQQLDGFSRLLTATQRAGQANIQTASGQQGVPFLLGSLLTDIFGGTGGAVTGAIGTGGLARMYESAPVRNRLMQLSQSNPGTPEEQQIVKRLLATLQTEQAKQLAPSLMQEEQP